MSRINAKLGLKPATRIRTATHGAGIVSSATCPNCPHRYVSERRISGALVRTCNYCGAQWVPVLTMEAC